MMNANTGRHMPLKEHIAQSIKNILFTRLGTRIQREDYGSLLPDLLDMPLSPSVVLLCYAATVAAIAQWEPRIEVLAVVINAEEAAAGRLKISITTALTDSGTIEKFEIKPDE